MKCFLVCLVVLLFSVNAIRVNGGVTPFPFVVDSSNVTLDCSGYDYIIVGAGASGCPLATTLSQKYKVLVLERGGSPYGEYIMSEGSFAAGIFDPEFSQPFLTADGVANNRPRSLGGGTAINAGFFSRAGRDEISRLGLDPAKVNSSYRWVEERIVTLPAGLGPFQFALRGGLLEAGVTPYNGVTLEHINGTKIGGTIFRNGIRHPASDLFYSANASNILVVLHAVVQRVLISDTGRAYGVEFTNRLGLDLKRAYLSVSSFSEVIVSASALGSPQLLMLSGLGPTDVLQAAGISQRVNLPVGKKIVDNPTTRLFIVSPTPIEVSLPRVAGIVPTGSYIIGGSLNSSLSAIFQKVNYPLSSGELRLTSRNADDVPYVKFNYYSDPNDVKICVGGANIVEEVLLSNSFVPYRTALQPLPSGGVVAAPNRRNPLLKNTVNATLEVFCKTRVDTEWHYHGSCRVGEVVDAKYRVLGVSRLRVIDASVLDFSPGTNPQATLMMLGRYMGLDIIQERT